MNKIIMAAVAAIAGTNLMGAVVNNATAPSGQDNIAFGYGAGYGSSGSNVNVIAIGTEAARASSWNTNSIFIGASAGRGMSGKDGAVVIGDVLVHTNGVTTIKGFSGGDGGDGSKVTVSGDPHGDYAHLVVANGAATNNVPLIRPYVSNDVDTTWANTAYTAIKLSDEGGDYVYRDYGMPVIKLGSTPRPIVSSSNMAIVIVPDPNNRTLLIYTSDVAGELTAVGKIQMSEP